MARFLVTTIGSLGDLHPMFPVVDALQKRGHSATFVLPEILVPAATAQGFHAFPIRMPRTPAEMEPEASSPTAVRSRIRKFYGPYLEAAISVLEAACDGADAILSTPHQIATAIVGERRRLPWVTLTVFPGLIPSAYTVPEPHWLPPLPTPAGRVVNRLTWRVFRYGLRYLASDVIDSAVDARGLPLGDSAYAPGGFSPHLCLVLSSPAYSPALPDWPPQVKVTGFSPGDETPGWSEPVELARFLEGGPPPVVVTSSTAGERDVVAYFETARKALLAGGRRGILLTGRATPELLGSSSYALMDGGIAAWPYLPLSRLLPRASLVVHHSGIGTAISTIRSGLPCVAVPASFDQWYNAGRIRTLGVGRVVEYRTLTVKRLAKEIEETSTRPRYRERAQRLSALMKNEDGVARACDEIEALVTSRANAISG